MDISRIRNLLRECYARQNDPREISAEQDYTEAEQCLRALKSLFEAELDNRNHKPSPPATTPPKRT